MKACRHFLSGIVLMGTALAVHAQSHFLQTTGGSGNEKGYGIYTFPRGDYLIAGWTTGIWGGEDMALYHFLENGDLDWVHLYGGPLVEFCSDMDRTSDGGLIITGYGKSFGLGDDDVYLVKTDSLGNLLWARAYGGPAKEVGTSVMETYDKGFIICGSTQSFGMGSNDMYLIKTDSAGNKMWSRTMGGDKSDIAYWVRECADSNLVVTGGYFSPAASVEAYMALFDPMGDLLWSRIYSGSSADQTNQVLQTRDGGFAMAGWTGSGGAGSFDGMIIKTDALGNLEWARAAGSPAFDQLESLVELDDSTLVAAGNTMGFGYATRSYFATALNASGQGLWSKAYGKNASSSAHRIHQHPDGTLLFTGETEQLGAVNKLTVKALENGDSGCDTSVAATFTSLSLAVIDTATYVLIPADSSVYIPLLDTTITLPDTMYCYACQPPVAAFSYYQSGDTVFFSDQSTGHIFRSWDLGDGSTSVQKTVTHQYTDTAETYVVCLTAGNGCGSDQICDTIMVSPIGLPDHAQHANYFPLKCWPNPATRHLYAEGGKGANGYWRVLDLAGKTLVRKEGQGERTYLDIGRLAPGSYLLEWHAGTGETARARFMVAGE